MNRRDMLKTSAAAVAATGMLPRAEAKPTPTGDKQIIEHYAATIYAIPVVAARRVLGLYRGDYSLSVLKDGQLLGNARIVVATEEDIDRFFKPVAVGDGFTPRMVAKIPSVRFGDDLTLRDFWVYTDPPEPADGFVNREGAGKLIGLPYATYGGRLWRMKGRKLYEIRDS